MSKIKVGDMVRLRDGVVGGVSVTTKHHSNWLTERMVEFMEGGRVVKVVEKHCKEWYRLEGDGRYWWKGWLDRVKEDGILGEGSLFAKVRQFNRECNAKGFDIRMLRGSLDYNINYKIKIFNRNCHKELLLSVLAHGSSFHKVKEVPDGVCFTLVSDKEVKEVADVIDRLVCSVGDMEEILDVEFGGEGNG